MNEEHELAFINAFIISEKRDRYRQMMANPKRRSKILQQLYHTLDTMPSRTALIAAKDHLPASVEAMLRNKGAGSTCYLISPNRTLDQQEIPLHEAIDPIIDSDTAAIACCIPSRFAYYKSEWDGYILEHESNAMANHNNHA